MKRCNLPFLLLLIRTLDTGAVSQAASSSSNGKGSVTKHVEATDACTQCPEFVLDLVAPRFLYSRYPKKGAHVQDPVWDRISVLKEAVDKFRAELEEAEENLRKSEVPGSEQRFSSTNWRDIRNKQRELLVKAEDEFWAANVPNDLQRRQLLREQERARYKEDLARRHLQRLASQQCAQYRPRPNWRDRPAPPARRFEKTANSVEPLKLPSAQASAGCSATGSTVAEGSRLGSKRPAEEKGSEHPKVSTRPDSTPSGAGLRLALARV